MNLTIFAFIIFVIGIFLVFDLSPFDIITMVKNRQQASHAKKSMVEIVKDAKTNKRDGYLKRLMAETKEILKVMNKTASFNFLLVLSMTLFVTGVFIALLMDNLFMIPVLAIGLGLAPFYYIKLIESRFLKLLNEELETALGVITTSYSRGNNTFINAVEENLPYLMPPVCHLFETFLFNVKNITPNTKDALVILKDGINNDIFKEWVDAVILCLDNQNLKPTLQPIVNKLSDLRAVTLEMENIMYPPIHEYICMVLLLISVIPIMYVLNRSWFHILVSTGFGKALMAVCAGTILITVTFVIKHVKPITYQGE